jgi:hypothetical protein
MFIFLIFSSPYVSDTNARPESLRAIEDLMVSVDRLAIADGEMLKHVKSPKTTSSNRNWSELAKEFKERPECRAARKAFQKKVEDTHDELMAALIET